MFKKIGMLFGCKKIGHINSSINVIMKCLWMLFSLESVKL